VAQAGQLFTLQRVACAQAAAQCWQQSVAGTAAAAASITHPPGFPNTSWKARRTQLITTVLLPKAKLAAAFIADR
jgi:hypothetical protein